MRTIDSLKLTQLSKAELEARQMNILKGGLPTDNSCVCNCSALTTQTATRDANAIYGYQYSYGGVYGTAITCGCIDNNPMVDIRSGN